MTNSHTVLAVLGDMTCRDEVDRIAAAVGVRVMHWSGSAPPSRRSWTGASVVVLDDVPDVLQMTRTMPRRGGVFLLSASEPGVATWQAAIAVGAQQVLCLPGDADSLIAAFSELDEPALAAGDGGRVVAVVGGRGGAGASVFSAALALVAGDAMLVDVDPWGGGLDLLLGTERLAGLRWPDLAVQDGRLTLSALRDALPQERGVTVLSCARAPHDVPAGQLLAVVGAGRRGAATVICDVPRRLTAAAEAAVDVADLVVLVGQCDLRSCASIAAMAPTLLAMNPNVGLVVRGPSPGGLRASEVARSVRLPLLATVRADARLAELLEHGGLRLGRRSALASAAGRVLALLDRQSGAGAA